MKSTVQKLVLLLTLSVFLTASAFPQLILFHPRNVAECEGITTINYSVTLNKGIIATFQWQVRPPRTILWTNIDSKNMPNASGYNSRTLSLEFSKTTGGPLTTEWDGTRFRCVVTSGKTKEESNAAYLYVSTIPVIYSQPSGATKFAGESVTFSLGATGATSYLWYKNGTAIDGATGPVLTITDLVESDAGTYSCRATNSCGTRTSASAVLIVNVPEFADGWFEQPNPRTETIQQISIVTKYIAWAVFWDTDRLLHTTDGGKTWTPRTTGIPRNWRSIEFISDKIGFVGGYNGIGKTSDGGENWTFLDLKASFGIVDPAAYFYVYDIEFADTQTGYMAGSSGFIAKTTDGGVNWALQNYDGDNFPTINADLRSIHFIDAVNGYAAGYSGTIIKTTNGGNSWMKLETGVSDNFLDISMIDTNTGFVAGGYNSLFKIMNGGSTFLEYTNTIFPKLRYMNSITFLDGQNGYIAGAQYDGEYRGSVAKTIDGGETWYVQEVNPIEATTYFNDIVMLDVINGWTGGTNGNIWRTASGGCLNPGVDLGADHAFCASGNVILDASEGNSNCLYEWSTGATKDRITVNSSGTYWVNVMNLCNVTATDSININVFPLPEAYAGENAYACAGDSIQLIAEGGISYQWNNPQYLTEPDIQNPICAPPQGTTTFTVTVTDQNGCTNSDNVDVIVGYPYENEKICMVTIDLVTGKNMVVWERTTGVGIATYNVYRLGTGGIYNLIGSVPAEEISIFVDQSSEPEKTQYLYKISALDTCGNESSKSNYHKTLFLQYTSSVGGVNLLWQDYQIENESVDFSDFVIYRGSDSTALAVIDTVSGTNVYTDTDPMALSQKMYYRVAGVKPSPCDPAKFLSGKKAGSGPFVHSLSNLEDNRLKTGLEDALAKELNLRIFPNPITHTSRLLYTLKEVADVRIEFYSIIGERISFYSTQDQVAGDQEIEISRDNFGGKSGMYYVRIWINDVYLTRKVLVK